MEQQQQAEIWKDIPGQYMGHYQASSLGRIRSLDRETVDSMGRRRSFEGRIRAETLNLHGYLQVGLSVAGKHRTCQIHRLIAAAWHGSSELQTRHMDGDKLNNRPDNLRHGTAEENAADRQRHGRTARGESNGRASLNADQVLEIRQIHSAGGRSLKAIGLDYGVNRRTIHRVIKGITWTHLDSAQEGAA